jgi:hypothetical protein
LAKHNDDESSFLNNNNNNLPLPDLSCDGENCLIDHHHEDDEDEFMELCQGDNCRIIQYDHEEEDHHTDLQLDKILRWAPMVLPFFAYTMYDPTAQLFATAIDLLRGNNNWVAVDGGAYQAKIIAPVINGVVVPAISILFAVLIGNTINTLRQRQIAIHLAVQIEATQLRMLQNMLDFFPEGGLTQEKCRMYLLQYTSRLIAEGHETVNLEALYSSGMESELNGVLQELNNQCSAKKQQQQQQKEEQVALPILGQSLASVHRLYEERAKRITALQSTFPPLHYIIVGTLALCICLSFLISTDQEILVFLNAIQLRLLWTMLVGTFCTLGLVCYDLGNPFRGSYQISKSVDQLYTIRDGFETALHLAAASGSRSEPKQQQQQQ